MWDVVQVAWAAGLIEGEGSIGLSKGRTSQHDGVQRYQPCLRAAMTDLDILERLRAVFGYGTVIPYNTLSRLGAKPMFLWSINKTDEVVAVCAAIYEFMGTRRRTQIDKVLAYLEKHPPVTSGERARRTWTTRRERGNDRKTACLRGHSMVEANVYVQPKTGKRGCKECRRLLTRESRRRVSARHGALA